MLAGDMEKGDGHSMKGRQQKEETGCANDDYNNEARQYAQGAWI